MTENKSSAMIDVLPIMSKITDRKLTNSNYLEWSKTIRLYLRSIDKDDHLIKDPPTTQEPTDLIWSIEDARLFLQIRNSIDNEVINLINHCEFVKEPMGYVEFIYSGKGNLTRMFGVCKAFYRAEKRNQTLTNYFMSFKQTYEELNELLPMSTEIKIQQQQREQMAIMSFPVRLPSEFDSAKSQILSGSSISSLQEVFSRILRTENSSTSSNNHVSNSALISSSNNPTAYHNSLNHHQISGHHGTPYNDQNHGDLHQHNHGDLKEIYGDQIIKFVHIARSQTT